MKSIYFPVLGVLTFSLGVIVWFRLARSFDRIIKFIYENDRNEWIEWGQPIGLFWRPKSETIKFIKSTNARNRLFFILLIKDVSGFQLLSVKVRRFRVVMAIWLLLCCVMLWIIT